MKFFETAMNYAAKLPDYVCFYACPALLLIVGFILAIFHKKKVYWVVAFLLGGIGLFLVASSSRSTPVICAWGGLYIAIMVLVRLFFCFSYGREAKHKPTEQEEVDEMYKKFHLDLVIPDNMEFETSAPPIIAMEESGVRLQYVFDLIKKLEACDLSPSDRLEADAIRSTLSAYEGKELSKEEYSIVNDSLASVLKLTAKYKL